LIKELIFTSNAFLKYSLGVGQYHHVSAITGYILGVMN